MDTVSTRLTPHLCSSSSYEKKQNQQQKNNIFAFLCSVELFSLHYKYLDTHPLVKIMLMSLTLQNNNLKKEQNSDNELDFLHLYTT